MNDNQTISIMAAVIFASLQASPYIKHDKDLIRFSLDSAYKLFTAQKEKP